MTEDEIRGVLRARKLYVIKEKHYTEKWKHWKTGEPGRTKFHYYIVIWEDKDRIKYGHINHDYTHRYGIDVRATFNGRTHWFKSNDIADKIPDEHLNYMKHLYKEGSLGLVEFNPDKINVSW